ncbi:MAG: LysE family translocator, partial [Vicinamibacteria bacterium]|nr:LysE family translocator [Vicinamibacteria bacterium]
MRHASISSGLRFGLLLQLAIGPVCLFVLKTAAEQGFVSGLLAVTGVAIVDAAYIALATLGITRWAESERMQRSLRFGGAAVLVLFGLDILASDHERATGGPTEVVRDQGNAIRQCRPHGRQRHR